MKIKATLFLIIIMLSSCVESAPIDSQPFRRYQLDNYTITTIYDSRVTIEKSMLTNVTPGILFMYLGDNNCYTNKNTFIIERDKTVILIDSGLSNILGSRSGFFLNNLAMAGYKPEDIRFILLNHINTDIGGETEVEGVKQFPNAKVYISKPEYDFWVTPDNKSYAAVPLNRRYNFDRATTFANLYTDVEKFVKDNSTSSRDNITINGNVNFKIIPLKGYTSGQYGFEIMIDNNSVIFSGDVFACIQAQFLLSLINTTTDLFPTDSVITRGMVLDNYTILKYTPNTPTYDDEGNLIEDNLTRRNKESIIAGAHLPFPSFYKIFKTTEGTQYIIVNSSDLKDDLYKR